MKSLILIRLPDLKSFDFSKELICLEYIFKQMEELSLIMGEFGAIGKHQKYEGHAFRCYYFFYYSYSAMRQFGPNT